MRRSSDYLSLDSASPKKQCLTCSTPVERSPGSFGERFTQSFFGAMWLPSTTFDAINFPTNAVVCTNWMRFGAIEEADIVMAPALNSLPIASFYWTVAPRTFIIPFFFYPSHH
jgi:hypothetical protein